MNTTETVTDKLENLLGVLGSYRFRFGTEEVLQDAVERVLQDAKIPYERERDLGDAGRIDFLVENTIGLEIKTKGSPTEVAEQVIRYCTRDEISIVVLLTARMTLGKLVPRKVHGKKVLVVGIWENMI